MRRSIFFFRNTLALRHPSDIIAFYCASRTVVYAPSIHSEEPILAFPALVVREPPTRPSFQRVIEPVRYHSACRVTLQKPVISYIRHAVSCISKAVFVIAIHIAPTVADVISGAAVVFTSLAGVHCVGVSGDPFDCVIVSYSIQSSKGTHFPVPPAFFVIACIIAHSVFSLFGSTASV